MMAILRKIKQTLVAVSVLLSLLTKSSGLVGVRSDIAQTSPHMFFVAAVPLTLQMQHSVHSNPFSPQPAEPREEKNAIIVGASVGGLSAALALQRAGFDVQVFEKAKKLRPAGAAFGIFENGRAALQAISPFALERLDQTCVDQVKLTVRDMLNKQIQVTKSPTSQLVSFWKLQESLLKGLPPTCLHLDHLFQGFEIDESAGRIRARFYRANGETTAEADLLIGADGINSAVRKAMIGNVAQRYHGKIIYRAPVEISRVGPRLMPETGEAVRWVADDPAHLLTWQQIAPDWLAFTGTRKSATGDVPMDSISQRRATKEAFAQFPGTVQEIMKLPEPEAIYVAPVKDLDFCETWTDGRVAILGDAAHAMTPALGMGANMALEDAAELLHFLGDRSMPLDRALSRWEVSRRTRVQRVHARSRQRTEENNKSNFMLNNPSADLMDFMAEVRRYRPPSG